jgi:hypothetical protein
MTNNDELRLIIAKEQLRDFVDLLKYGQDIDIFKTLSSILDLVNEIAENIKAISNEGARMNPTVIQMYALTSRIYAEITEILIAYNDNDELTDNDIREMMLTRLHKLDIQAVNICHLVENRFRPIHPDYIPPILRIKVTPPTIRPQSAPGGPPPISGDEKDDKKVRPII